MEYNEVTEAGEKSFQPQAFSYSGVRSENPSLANVSKREFLNRPKLQKEVLGYRLDGKEDFDPLKEFEGIFENKIIPDNFSSTDGQINNTYDESETIEFSDGGEVNNNARTDELIRFEGGGTHEQNPLGGIPLGFGSNGKQNTVEEGETKFSFDDGDYIFSNRITTDGKSRDRSSNTNTFADGGYLGDPIKKAKLARLKKLLEEEKLKKNKTFEDKLKKKLEDNQTKQRNNTQQPKHRPKLDEKITTNKDGISLNEEGNLVLKNKKGIYEEVNLNTKKQPSISQNNKSREEISKSHKESDDKYRSDEFKESLKNNALKPVKVAADIASLGAFVPHPIAQEVAFLGRGVGATIDMYELTEDVRNEDYGSALINTAGLFLPMMTGSKTFMRNSKYSKHKKDLDNLLGDYGRTNYINTASRVKKQSKEALNANRALLGLSGVELAYDINNFANGGNLHQQNNKELIKYKNGSYILKNNKKNK